MPELVAGVDVKAPPEVVFAAATDWGRHREWMLGTSVAPVSRDGTGVGAALTARTGLGPVGFLDTMEIIDWAPPRRCVVRHTGRVVRGEGAFEVEPLLDGGSRFVWSEWLLLPFGLAGELGFVALRWVARAGLRHSLASFARWVEAGQDYPYP
jgi:uncharacterized protein YndB with AHSA1/START domain